MCRYHRNVQQNGDGCERCRGLGIIYESPRGPQINIAATVGALLAALASDQISILRGDCPLDQTIAMAETDRFYTVVHFLRCLHCDQVWFFGLCIRGQPTFHPSSSIDAAKWLWENNWDWAAHAPVGT